MHTRRGRRRAIPRIRADGAWFGFGPQEEDAISGWRFPKRFMVKQCGRLVSRFLRDGSYDLRESSFDAACPVGRPAPPRLSIVAVLPTADESGPVNGKFVIFRDGDKSQDLFVDLIILGTAKNGVDYQHIASQVLIGAGVSQVEIPVVPIPDAITEGPETVTIRIAPVVHSNYYVKLDQDTATVTIEEPVSTPQLLLRYEFEAGAFLENSGTAGPTFNLTENEVCEI